MKKSLLTVGAVSLAAVIGLSGCVSAEGDQRIAEANKFISGSQACMEHKLQKDEIANIMLNDSQQLYLLIGGAVADITKVNYGERDIMMLQNRLIQDDVFSKACASIKTKSQDAKAANDMLLDAVKQAIDPAGQDPIKLYGKKSAEQCLAIVLAKQAMQDYVKYRKATKANDKDALAEYDGMKDWLLQGRKEYKSSYGDAYKAAAAERDKKIAASRERNKQEFEKLGNKVLYLGSYIALVGADIAIKEAKNDFAKMAAVKAKEAVVAEMLEMEKKYPYVKEVTERIAKLNSPQAQLAYAKDLAEQYKYVISVAGSRLSYTAEAIAWYNASKSDLDAAAGEE